jgi:type VI secretion system secreted protein VgrG
MDKANFQIKSDSPVTPDLMFWQIAGHESLSRPAVYELVVLCKNAEIIATDVLGRAFGVNVEFFDSKNEKHKRYFHGHAVRIAKLGKLGPYHKYQLTLQSWFGLLTRRKNSRIIQDKPLIEAIKLVLEDSPIKKFLENFVPNDVSTLSAPIRYCVQHQETDFHFISRLLENAGIHYWFNCHDEKPNMYLSNDSQVSHDVLPITPALKLVPQGKNEARFNELTRWISIDHYSTGKHSAIDNPHKVPTKTLAVTTDFNGGYELSEFEDFEFPGTFIADDRAQDTSEIRAHEINAKRQRHFGATAWPDVSPGKLFDLEGHPDENQNIRYLIGSTTFVLTHPGYADVPDESASRSVGEVLIEFLKDDAFNSDGAVSLSSFIKEYFSNKKVIQGASIFFLSALPGDTKFKPPRLTPRVTMPGPQSAIVVGPKGQDYYVDKGRVKVHFQWDRYGERDELSTCWVRVSQPMAGQGWGGFFMPRIGQEVIVDFLNGDPDRPIIVGRVYNGHQNMPYESPTQSGFKTRSTPKGGSGDYNELMFEDKKGSELLSLHAQRNLSFTAEANKTTSVGNNSTTIINVNESTHVGGTETNITEGMQTNSVTGIQHTTITGLQVLFADSGQEITAKGTSLQVNGIRDAVITEDDRLTVTGVRRTEVKADDQLKVTGYKYAHIGGYYTLIADGNIKIKSEGVRTDVAKGDFSVITDSTYKLMANSGIKIMTPASIDCTSFSSNTTIIGANTSGYIGNNSEANLGIAQTSFLGMSTENSLGLSSANFLGMSTENFLGIKTSLCAAISIEMGLMINNTAALHVVQTGPAAPGTMAAIANSSPVVGLGALVAGMGLGFGGVSFFSGIAATREQYKDALKDLDDAIEAANQEGFTGLARRMGALRSAAEDRQDDFGFIRGDQVKQLQAENDKAEQGPTSTAIIQQEEVDPFAEKPKVDLKPDVTNPGADADTKLAEAKKNLDAKKADLKSRQDEAQKVLDNERSKIEDVKASLDKVEAAKQDVQTAATQAKSAAVDAANEAAEKAKQELAAKAMEAFPKPPNVPPVPSVPTVPPMPTPPPIPGR